MAGRWRWSVRCGRNPLWTVAMAVALAGAVGVAAPRVGAEASAGGAPAGQGGTLSLSEALALAIERNPALAAFGWDVRSSEESALQGGLRPNPTLTVDVENVAGSGERESFDQSETTLAISQLVELGGKRAKRRALGDAQARISAWQYEATRLDVVAETTDAFLDALAQQRSVELEQDQIRLATGLLERMHQQVRDGEVDLADDLRAQIEVTKQEIELQLRQRALRAAYVRLATAWGDDEPAFRVVAGDLEAVDPLPSESSLVAKLKSSPRLARWQAEVTARRAAVALADARGIPDLTLGLGPRHFNDTDDWAMVVGVSLPIPLFDRNQFARRASRRTLDGARERRRNAALVQRRALARAYQRLASAADATAVLRTRAIPTAERAYAAVQNAQRSGSAGVTEMLDAQRTLFGLRTQEVVALASYHSARAETEAILGSALTP